MKTILQQIAEKNRKEEVAERKALKAEINNPATSSDRRNFLTPGLGIELDEENIKAMMQKDAVYFDATPEWNRSGGSYDKLWI